jgi:hypothetical protein
MGKNCPTGFIRTRREALGCRQSMGAVFFMISSRTEQGQEG